MSSVGPWGSTSWGSAVACALALLLGAGCLRQAGSEQGRASVDADVEAEAALQCLSSSDAAIAVLEPGDGSRCGVAIELTDESLELRALTTTGGLPVVGRGDAPPSCGPGLELCVIAGVVDPHLGPLVILSQRGPESDMPVQVYLGWVVDGRLGFVDAWYGLPSVVDHTRVGPPWALAVHDCDGALALLPTPRLPESEVEDPPEVLVALAGPWTVDAEGEAVSQASAGATMSSESCRLAQPMP